MTVKDWKSTIVSGVLIQQRIEQLDTGGLWKRYLPEVAASEEAIRAAEQSLGAPLDRRFREFLLHANGWRGFYQAVDLYGTPQLLGAPPMDTAIRQLSAVSADAFLELAGVPLSDVRPIASSAVQPDMFLLAGPFSAAPGQVIWYTGAVVERLRDFDEFFLAILDYNRDEVRDLEREATKLSASES